MDACIYLVSTISQWLQLCWLSAAANESEFIQKLSTDGWHRQVGLIGSANAFLVCLLIFGFEAKTEHAGQNASIDKLDLRGKRKEQ